MNNTQNFCENCGLALAADSRFCEKCGTPVQVEPPVVPTTPAPTVQPVTPAAAQRFNSSAVLLSALILVLLVAAVTAFWIFAPSSSDPAPAPADSADLTAPPKAAMETADILPPMTGDVPVAPSTIPESDPAAASESPTEDWFASQPWFQKLADSMPEGVTLQLFARPDDELPGATTVEVRANHAPDSGFDPDISPLVGIFRVTADRSKILYLDVVESDYVPLERFLASRRSPAPVPDLPSTATPAEAPAALSPVEIVYRKFMDEAFRSRGGDLRVGAPHITDHRIDNTLTVKGVKLAYVFVEISNDGKNAEVLVGPQDAGADRTYTLERGREGWTIKEVKEGEF